MTVESNSLEMKMDAALKAAMKAKDAVRVSTLRMVRSALKNKQIEKRSELAEEDVLQVLATQAKQRRESIEQFRAAGRMDLVQKEEAELAVLQDFLPQALTDEELRGMVRDAVGEVGAQGPKDMGKVMSVLMPRIRGRAEGGTVNHLVREVLAQEMNG